MRHHKQILVIRATLRHVRAQYYDSQAATPNPVAQTVPPLAATYITTHSETILSASTDSVNLNTKRDSAEQITRSTNITIGVIAVFVCVTTMIILYVLYNFSRSKEHREIMRMIAEEEQAGRRNPTIPTVPASRPNSIDRPRARAFYGDQIFRHELRDGSELEKDEKKNKKKCTGVGSTGTKEDESILSSGGGTGSADSDGGHVAELNGISDWDVPLATFKERLKRIVSKPPQHHELS